MAKNKEYQRAVSQLKKYYSGLTQISCLQRKIETLVVQREKIVTDIENSRISLNVTVPGINYTMVKVQSSYMQSAQEQAIDKAFDMLEQRLQKIELDIAQAHIEIMNLEGKTYEMRFIIDQLEPYQQELLNMLYGKKYTCTYIADKLFVSEVTVGRHRDKIMQEIGELLPMEI